MIIGEIVNVKVNGVWYEGEIVDVTKTAFVVYVYDMGRKVVATKGSIKR